ncbi:MAG TPA: sensor histidine kinase [Bryobacteraceae bacterium]|nr:sensor histidine kinase [Bryobacteraceae bacterium]
MDDRAGAAIRYPDSGAWAEMLAEICDKNARLSEVVSHKWPSRRNSAPLLAELERERSRIARELHAGAGQPLAGIKIHLEILEEFAAAIPDAATMDSARMTIDRLQTLAEQALGQVRAVSHRLHPPEWQEMTLDKALESLVDSSGLAGLRLTKSLPALQEEPSHAAKVQIYRCAQECISNIVRHSGATEASISLRAEEGNVVLTVIDNGRGFDTGAKSAGIGLKAISENAQSLGGTARITSSAAGTRIVVKIPRSAD